MECPEEEPVKGDPIDLEQERRISSLAMRYRLGERSVLGELYAELERFIRSSIRRRVVGTRLLPPSVALEDLYQQAYVVLAEAVMEWDPARRRNFVPYFLRSFPWRIDHYLRSQTPSRRTSRFQMISMPHDELMESIAGRPGPDGRDWDGALACEDLLRRVPRSDRRVVRLHLFNGLPFAEVGKVMGISRSAAHEAFVRAIGLMKALLDKE